MDIIEIPTQFVNYIPTPGEKQLGIATINYGSVLLRFRINAGKDGTGFYITPSAHKLGERYFDSFEIDSKREHTRVMNLIRDNVNKLINQPKEMPLSASAFDGELPF